MSERIAFHVVSPGVVIVDGDIPAGCHDRVRFVARKLLGNLGKHAYGESTYAARALGVPHVGGGREALRGIWLEHENKEDGS